MGGGQISFTLFTRPGAPASDAALDALRQYARGRTDLDLQVVDLAAQPELAARENIVIVPTLKIRTSDASKILVTGLAPLDVLRTTLAFLEG